MVSVLLKIVRRIMHPMQNHLEAPAISKLEKLPLLQSCRSLQAVWIQPEGQERVKAAGKD